MNAFIHHSREPLPACRDSRHPHRSHPLRAPLCLAVLLALATPIALAQQTTEPDEKVPVDALDPVDPDPIDLDGLTVVGRRQNLVGEAISASEGSVGQAEIAARPFLRSGDLLEFVPGLVATQHSGSGKANQYFLRGFNLDHGTDFATFVDSMPVNMRTHGHGQGYTDLNFLIPETVHELHYRKGPYYADVGDFSSAGSARFRLADRVEQGLAELTAGDYGYLRGVVVDSIDTGADDGAFLYAGEVLRNDGPWTDIEEDVRKYNAMLKYSADVAGGRAAITALGYQNRWNAADQIPERAVRGAGNGIGLIDELGSIDTTGGGESSRYSLSADWRGPALGGDLRASAYVIDSYLSLYSNFTYFLDDPVNGDQFRQLDDRQIYGFELSQHWERGRSRWRAGAQGRLDDIDKVGLYKTRARQPVSTVREDAVTESSIGVYVANEFQFNEHWRSYVGVRHDTYRFEVDALSLPINSGEVQDDATSLKASLAWKPSESMEYYASYGQGFHSNDARGTTIRIDPGHADKPGEPATPVDPLVGSEGYELGARFYFSNALHATVALWRLDLESELLFVGDAGNTEASRPSRRDGIEVGVYWFGNRWWEADLEASYTDAYFTDRDPVGEHIPGAIPLVVSAGLTGRLDSGALAGVFSTLRVRHFSSYPLIEDASVESDGSTLVNLRIGKDWQRVGSARIGVYLDVFNLLDSDDHDIDYYYASRLPGEPAGGVEDIHFHPFAPRSVRLSVRWSF